ncbi:MAG: 2Fe-2S iron-sulfur cluster-binding protein [Cyclobacteriaceae bacterium]|nr:2Fe-2S iron-sulfur cluster-binding protein [Cyclobacteriaceae bacterium]
MNRIKIKITDKVGLTHTLEAPTDMNLNLMELCKAAELPIEGTCGGMALCASCHCYIVSGHRLPEVSEQEEIMLDQVFTLRDNSRLGCQLRLTTELDGLEVQLP